MSRLDLEKIREAANGSWDYILRALAPDLGPALDAAPRHTACPVHGGSDGFRFFRDVSDTGGGICNTCINPATGKHGLANGFETLAWAKGYELIEAFREVSDLLDTGKVTAAPVRKAPSQAEKRKDERKAKRQRAKIRALWSEAVPVTHPQAEPGRRYLLRRGLDALQAPPQLRFHPAMPYWMPGNGGKPVLLGEFPGLVAPVVTAEGRLATLHQTFLTDTGAKAPVPKVKKLHSYPSDDLLISGGMLQLHPPLRIGPVLGLSEGLETAMSVEQAYGCRFPVQPAYSTALLERIVLPPWVRLVLIFGDKDRKKGGQHAAEAAMEKLREEGRMVEVFLPDGDIPDGAKSLDWNDVYRAEGAAAFPQIEDLIRTAIAS